MNKYIVVKEREKFNIPNLEENKKKEVIQSESITETKEKTILPIKTVDTTKEKLSFSPLIIKEEKTEKTISVLTPSDDKKSPSLPTYKEEIQKSKIELSSKLSERKNRFSIETIISKENKNSPTFTPLKIESKSKEKEVLKFPNRIVSKVKGNDLLQNEPIISKEKEPIFADITERKEKENLSYDYELLQKTKKPLEVSSDEKKNNFKLEDIPETQSIKRFFVNDDTEVINKEDAPVDVEFENISKDDVGLEQLIAQTKDMLGITGEISEEDKNKLALIIPQIENLATNGKIDPSKKIKEKGKADEGLWGEVKDILEELLGFNLEIATLKSLLMPPELDKLLSDIKTFKGNVVHGEIIDSINNGFNLTNELFDKIEHFNLGELAGVYASNFFTITGFKPSPSIKNPGRKMIGDDEWTSGVLLNADDPFGSIEDENNTVLRKIGRFTDLRGLKNFGINQLGNLLRGFAFSKIKTSDRTKQLFSRDSGNIKGDAAKDNNAIEAPSGLDLVFGTFDPAIRNGDWGNLFDPAMRLGGISKEFSDKMSLDDLEKTINNLNPFTLLNGISDTIIEKLNLDPGNSKANEVKEVLTKKLTNPKFDTALKNLGVSKGKLSELFSKKEDLLNQLGYNTKLQKGTDNSGYGYDIASTETAEDIPYINILSDMEYSNQNLNTLRESIRQNYLSLEYRNNYNIGYMIVEPADYSNNFQKFKIDFQFNPEINEGSIKARYDTTTILNRIGQLETYIGTDSMTAQIKLKYRVLSRNPKKGKSWMSKWTLDYIQQIEMALRALTVPAVLPKNGGTRTTRPPVIRIEMGDRTNLFKFPILTNKSQRWRYFIATDVTINKFYDGNTYYLDYTNGNNPDYYARDMMGFDADISLTEVKKSYFTYYPNFNDYYNSVMQNSNQQSLQNFVYNGEF